ncbi:TIGR02530 family flagellar biosynthesis protein [Gorillibacterium massiliense]|uniref:TIGR02530 family flagellar biosynthesis protein n=1 Tax=Gorillibacterium massiliense TaxID=1280390 RepID=UPI000593091F|nr:TIGR02530 family flagellar biosynthesis protein [Gorillibacterium massiliense]
MSDRLSIGQLYPGRVAPLTPVSQGTRGSKIGETAGTEQISFQDILQKELKLSHHAELRLEQRGIRLKPEQLNKIQTAVDKAAAKGAKDSLVLMNDMALIVNIKNRTIVTAMDGASLQDNVFTQIDSAIIVS